MCDNVACDANIVIKLYVASDIVIFFEFFTAKDLVFTCAAIKCVGCINQKLTLYSQKLMFSEQNTELRKDLRL